MIVSAVVVLSGFSGCASTESAEEKENRVSTLPWNTPQKWERSANIGGGVNY